MEGVTIKNIGEIEPFSGENAISGIRFRALGRALGVSAWGMNVLELAPGCDDYPEHHHQSDGHEEVYLVLEGALVLQVAGKERSLRAGDVVRVAPATSRKFVTRANGATLLALGGTPGKPYQPSFGG